MQKIPVYKIDMESPEHGLKKVSFVENPAMESDFIALASEEIKLAKNEDEQVLTGALIIPDKKILRVDAEGNPFYIVFSKEQIKEARNKFFKEARIGLTNFEHDYDLEGNYIVEAWIVENSEQDKSVALGLGSFPVGTLMLSYKVEDKDFWEKEVKTGNVKGFSLEGLFSMNEIKLKKEDKMLKTILTNLGKVFKVNLMEMTLQDGSVIFQDEETGTVYMINEDGSQGDVLADGEYTLENGKSIMIEEGKIKVEDNGDEEEMEKLKAELEDAKSKLAELESEKAELSKEVETKLSKEDFEAKLSEQIKEKDSKIEEIEAELSKAKAEIVELNKKPASEGVEEGKENKSKKPMTVKEMAVAVSV